MAAALDLDKNQPAVTALGCSMTPDEDNVIPLPPDRRGPPAPVQPPPSYEPEQSLLGAILVRPEVFPAVIDAGVKSESFSGAAHGRIFQAMLDLYGRGEPVDLVTVTALLKERGKLEGAGRPQEP
jgi:replicative DNA helicase